MFRLIRKAAIGGHAPRWCWQFAAYLHEAARRGDLGAVRNHIRMGADPHARCRDGLTVLHHAVKASITNVQVIEHLVSCGVDADARCTQGVTPLLAATGDRRKDAMACLIRLGADLKTRDFNGWNILQHAVVSKDWTILEYVLKKGVEIDSLADGGGTVLHLAAKDGNLELVQHLVYLGADIHLRDMHDWHSLHHACLSKNVKLIEYLLNKGLDVNSRTTTGKTPLSICSKYGSLDTARKLVQFGAYLGAKDWKGRSCLHAAAEAANVEVAEYLVQKGLDVNEAHENDMTPIFFAVRSGSVRMVESLIKMDADLYASLKYGRRAIHLAAQRGDAEIVQCLLKHGACVYAAEPCGLSALHVALQFHSAKVLSYLANSGHCDIEAGYEDRPTTPLLDCCRAGFTEGVRILLDAGANTKATDTHRMTPLHIACRLGHQDIVRLLLLSGADRHVLDEFKRTPFQCLPFREIIDYRRLRQYENAERPLNKHKGLDGIIETPGIGKVKTLGVALTEDFGREVLTFLVRLPLIGEICRHQYNLTLNLCGSIAEGTKVGLPDEIDVLFQFDLNDEKCVVKHTYPGYAEYSRNRHIFVHEGSRSFHNAFFDGFKPFLMFPEFKKLRIRGITFMDGLGSPLETVQDVNRKASTCLQLKWSDRKDCVAISVDAVPCLHVKAWPGDAVQSTWLMDNDELKAHGYWLVPKPPKPDSEVAKMEKNYQQLWRVSFTPLEVAHMQSLDDRLKDVFIAAKCLRNPDVCGLMIMDGGRLPRGVDSYLTSYFLKMSFMKNVEGFMASDMTLEEMVCKVYSDLADDLSRGFVPVFFMPTANALDGFSLDIRDCATVAQRMKTWVKQLHAGNGDPRSSGQEMARKMIRPSELNVFFSMVAPRHEKRTRLDYIYL